MYHKNNHSSWAQPSEPAYGCETKLLKKRWRVNICKEQLGCITCEWIHILGVWRSKAHADRGPIFFMVGMYIEIFDFFGVYITILTEKPQTLTWWKARLKPVNVFGPSFAICYIYPHISQRFLYTPFL